jgi:periplasmic divalent cation tolerance protein
MDPQHVQITTTTATRDEADAIAGGLVQARLAACVQIVGPIESTYWWNGRVERSSEWMCIVKTSHRLTDRVLKAVGERHPYDNPELTVVPILDGSRPYLEWIDQEVLGNAGSE